MLYIYAPNILLGIANPLDSDNTNNQVILILKYYLYKCRWLGEKPSINGGLKYLKYCIKIEKTTINFLSSTQKNIYVKSACHLKLSLVFEVSVQCCKISLVCVKLYIYMSYDVFVFVSAFGFL
jgi:hypothetical protein